MASSFYRGIGWCSTGLQQSLDMEKGWNLSNPTALQVGRSILMNVSAMFFKYLNVEY